MCHYMFLNDIDTQRWTLMGIVVKIAQSVCEMMFISSQS